MTGKNALVTMTLVNEVLAMGQPDTILFESEAAYRRAERFARTGVIGPRFPRLMPYLGQVGLMLAEELRGHPHDSVARIRIR
jgi:hypothetical protein